MNFFKKAVFCVAVASGVSLSTMAPALPCRASNRAKTCA